MAKFERTPEMEQKMVMDSFGGNVEMDLKVRIEYAGNKLKAYSPKLGCYLQFPKKLRDVYRVFVCDATEAQNNGRVFYRAYKGTIRDADTGEVVG
jgi:hypothetical protein